MCFSAQASFLASGLLLPLGAVALEMAWAKGQHRMLPLAVAPFLFGLQQACEGVVWLGIEPHSLVAPAGMPASSLWASLAFLFFAYAFWPVWMPLAAISLWPSPAKGHWPLGRAIPLLGLLPGGLLWWPMLDHPQEALPERIGHSLAYGLPDWSAHLLPPLLGPGLYAALIVVPLLLVSSPRVRCFALSLLAAFAITQWATSHALTSVWCYASALLSLQILWILQGEELGQATGHPAATTTT